MVNKLNTHEKQINKQKKQSYEIYEKSSNFASNIKRTFLFNLKTSGNLWFSDDFSDDRS